MSRPTAQAGCRGRGVGGDAMGLAKDVEKSASGRVLRFKDVIVVVTLLSLNYKHLKRKTGSKSNANTTS